KRGAFTGRPNQDIVSATISPLEQAGRLFTGDHTMAYSFRGRRGGGGGSFKVRLLLALIVAGGALISYYGTREYNPITDEVQHVDLSVDQEIALGLQAAPEMAPQHGGEAPDPQAQALVDRVGQRLLERSTAKDSPYKVDFH